MENYKKIDKTINGSKAQWMTLILSIPITVIFYLPYYFIWRNRTDGLQNESIFKELTPEKIFIIAAIIIGGIVLHEFIHGISWAIFAKNKFRSIRFGVIWKYLMPYCHCNEPLLVRHYLFGVLMPSIVVGILPCIIAIIFGIKDLALIGLFFTFAAGGDFMIAYNLLKENPKDFVQDHPSEAGYYLYTMDYEKAN